MLAAMAGISENALSQTYYVSATGSDSGTGTLASPFKTIAKAVSVVQAGETIYVRGGTYSLTATITLNKSGTENARISLLAYPGEKPVLDFSAQTLSGSNRGVVLTGSYWLVRGLDITGAGDNGMLISGGNNNIIELCNFYRNRDSGLQIDNGASNNTIINCDSYFNADPPDYGDADGSLPHIEYMHLAAGSDLIDAGVNVGLPYAGTAPDLGCFETGLTAAGGIRSSHAVIFYPNPITDIGFIRLTSDAGGRCEILLYDVTGRLIKTIADKVIEPGEHVFRLDLSDTREGLYLYRIKLNQKQLSIGRIIKVQSAN